MANFVANKDESRVSEIDKSEKNPFKWEWMDKVIHVVVDGKPLDRKLGESIKKLAEPGKAWCTLCSAVISYGGRGAAAIVDHVQKSKKHSKLLTVKLTNYSLPSFSASTQGQGEITTKKFVPLCDRVANSENESPYSETTEDYEYEVPTRRGRGRGRGQRARSSSRSRGGFQNESPYSETTEDYEYEVPTRRGRGRGRGQRARSSSRSRGGSVRGRGTGRQLGKRKARGRSFDEEEIDRLRGLQEEKKRKADELVESTDLEMAHKLLKGIAEKMPSLLLDVADIVSSGAGYEPEDPLPGGDDVYPSWCVCHHCQDMATDLEKVCCQMRPDLCSSIRPEMDLVITEPMALHINMLYRNDVLALQADGEGNINKAYRHAAYRSYILHEYGRLSARDRRVVPSCVTWHIRDRFPDPNGQYVGFIPTF